MSEAGDTDYVFRANCGVTGLPGEGNMTNHVVFGGAVRLPLEPTLDPVTTAALTRWLHRPDRRAPFPECFHAPDVSCILMDAQVRPAAYFPRASANVLVESIVRTFVFPHGVSSVASLDPFILRSIYKVIAVEGQQYLLVCPFLDIEGQRVGGLVLVDLDERLARRGRTGKCAREPGSATPIAQNGRIPTGDTITVAPHRSFS